MPAPMPNGIPIRLARARTTPEPTMAFSMPPPFSPTGTGILVKKSQLSDVTPCFSRSKRIAISGVMTTSVASTASTLTAPLLKRRLKILTLDARNGGRIDWDAISGHPRRCAARHGPNQQTCAGIHDDRNQEERQSDFDERTQVHVVGSLAEFVGQHAGHAVTGRQQRLHNLGTIADHHGDSHGL